MSATQRTTLSTTSNGPDSKIIPLLPESLTMVVPLSVTVNVAFNAVTVSSMVTGDVNETTPKIYSAPVQLVIAVLSGIRSSLLFSSVPVMGPELPLTVSCESHAWPGLKLVVSTGLAVAGPEVLGVPEFPTLVGVE